MQRAAGKHFVVHSPDASVQGKFRTRHHAGVESRREWPHPVSSNPQNVVDAFNAFINSGGVLPPPASRTCSTTRPRRRQAGADLAVVTNDAELRMASGLALIGVSSTARPVAARRRTWARRACCYVSDFHQQ